MTKMAAISGRVLVAGGAGFIGSHLCERLVGLGCDVLCVDNLFTGNESNIRHLFESGRFEFRRHDVTVPMVTEADAIINLACPASPIHYQLDPIRTNKTAVLGTLHMLSLAQKLSVPMLQASTSEVYGDPLQHPQHETYWGNVNPIGVRSCYDEGKRCAEAFCFDYNRQHNVQIKVARIFNTYGPRMHVNDGRVVSSFIVRALQGQDLVVYGNGSQTRSFCYVDDLVSGLLKLLGSHQAVTGPINLGRSEEFTILELAERVIELTGSRSKTVFADLPGDDPQQRRPDTTLASTLLDWRASTSLCDGLQRTINYFDQLLTRKGGVEAFDDHVAGCATPATPYVRETEFLDR